jgi:hypothetical protein
MHKAYTPVKKSHPGWGGFLDLMRLVCVVPAAVFENEADDRD